MIYKDVKIQNIGIDTADAFAQKRFNVFVVGLPRTGTSMMMGILERLGVNVIATSDSPEKIQRRKLKEQKRYGGGKYQMNPDGFFEITENPFEHYLEILATDYSGCKMIIPVLGIQWALLRYQPCKVIQMWRDPEEIRQSQQAAYKGDLLHTEEEAAAEVARIKTLMAIQKANLEQAGIETLHVQYQAVLKNPKKEIQRIANFIGYQDPLAVAQAWVDPAKNRFKKSKLTIGI